MTSHPSDSTTSISYPAPAIARAERAVRCSPFLLRLFDVMRWQRVELKAIAGERGVTSGYTRSPLSELAAENQLLWLMQVGLLRREVDGQGLTDSFRLTPLGRQLVERWEQESEQPQATGRDRLQNLWSRWVRVPSWFT